MARGIKRCVDQWETFMQSQMFKWKRKNLNYCQCGAHKNAHGTPATQCPEFKQREEVSNIAGSLRPLKFYEYVFPQESLQEVLAMQNLHQTDFSKMRPEANKMAWMIRKLMKLKKIPDMPDLRKKEAHEVTPKYVYREGVAVYPLGIKEDIPIDIKEYGYHQEPL